MCAVGIVLFLLVVPAFGQTADTRNRNQERELAAVEKQWWDSIKDHDRATLERVLADDFMGVDNGGEPATTKRQWVDWALTPTPAQPSYGFMNWYNNLDLKLLPSAPASAFMHTGNGRNMIYVDRENDVVAVVRWIDPNPKVVDEFVKRLLAAVTKK